MILILAILVSFLRRREVQDRTGLSKSTIYEKIKSGEFPKPVRLGDRDARSVGWVSSEVDEWIRGRIAARDGEGQ